MTPLGRPSVESRFAKGLSALLAFAVCGCTQPGDFGRPAPSVVVDEILPYAGRGAATLSGEPVSASMLTDDEKVLRDRAYRYLSPFWPELPLGGILAEFRRSRLVPASAAYASPNAYFDALMSDRWRSSRAPYRRLEGDIAADDALLGPFFATAQRVAGIDRIRLAGLSRLEAIGPGPRNEAQARVAENEDLVHAVKAALAARIVAYRTALDRLLLEIPEEAGVAAERRLAVLEQSLALRPSLLPGAPLRAAATASSTRSYFPGYRD